VHKKNLGVTAPNAPRGYGPARLTDRLRRARGLLYSASLLKLIRSEKYNVLILESFLHD